MWKYRNFRTIVSIHPTILNGGSICVRVAGRRNFKKILAYVTFTSRARRSCPIQVHQRRVQRRGGGRCIGTCDVFIIPVAQIAYRGYSQNARIIFIHEMVPRAVDNLYITIYLSINIICEEHLVRNGFIGTERGADPRREQQHRATIFIITRAMSDIRRDLGMSPVVD